LANSSASAIGFCKRGNLNALSSSRFTCSPQCLNVNRSRTHTVSNPHLLYWRQAMYHKSSQSTLPEWRLNLRAAFNAYRNGHIQYQDLIAIRERAFTQLASVNPFRDPPPAHVRKPVIYA
jgi:hypothetical protein